MTSLSFFLVVSELNDLKYLQVVHLFSLMHRIVCPLKFVYVSK